MNSSVELRWLPAPFTSALHATESLASGYTLIDPRVGEALAEPVAYLMEVFSATRLPAEKLWRNLLPLSQGHGGPRQVAETALIKTLGRGAATDTLVSRLAACLAALDAAYRRLFPNLAEDLILRGKPLREQWEARGPGLLREIFRYTDERLAVANADVLLVQPVLGGGGAAHILYNSVRIEAVLTNPLPELPEVLRLGWLLAQLNLELPDLSERISAERLPLIAALALVPATLASGKEVELCQCSNALFASALDAWRISPPTEDLVTTLGQWWEEHLASRPPWPVALAALDRMVP